MAMKKPTAKAAPKNDDSVVYKVMAALLCACIETLAVQQVCKYYVKLDYMEVMRKAMLIGTFVFAALSVVAAVVGIAKRSSGKPFGYVLAVLNLLACAGACGSLYAMWTGPAIFLYFAFFALAVLISVFLLYQPEFFLLSVCTVLAAFGFYCLSQLSGGHTAVKALMYLALGFVFVLTGVIALLAARGKGYLSFGSFRWRAVLLPSPMPLYIASVLWLLCLLAGLFLGAFFFYCCIFAAIAFEFIFAFYFTVKLK